MLKYFQVQILFFKTVFFWKSEKFMTEFKIILDVIKSLIYLINEPQWCSNPCSTRG